jgi:hypothetical protein
MAIQAQIILDNGITLSEAYVVITEVDLLHLPSDSSTASIQVIVYKDVTTRNESKPEVISFKHYVTYDEFFVYFTHDILDEEGKNPFSQAYEYIKTLTMYDNATDV